MTGTIKLSEYGDWQCDLKRQIKTEQIKATVSVNSRLIMLYWDLGRQIAEKQEKAQWGSGFIDRLSKDLREEFPEMTGFSARKSPVIAPFFLLCFCGIMKTVNKKYNENYEHTQSRRSSIP